MTFTYSHSFSELLYLHRYDGVGADHHSTFLLVQIDPGLPAEPCKHWWGKAVSDSTWSPQEGGLSGLSPPLSQAAPPTQVAWE